MKTTTQTKNEITRAKEAGSQMAALLCKQLGASQRKSLEAIVISINHDKDVPEPFKEKVIALLRERYRSIQDPFKKEGYTHILQGDIPLRGAPIVYEQSMREKFVSQESRLTYELEDHRDYGYPFVRLNLDVNRQTVVDATSCSAVYESWIKVDDHLFRIVENLSPHSRGKTQIDISPKEPATNEQMARLIAPVYKSPKLPSRVIWRIKEAREAIVTIKEDNYSGDGRNSHRPPAPIKLTERIAGALKELDSIPLYGKNTVPQSVKQEMNVAVSAINSIVKYYENCGFPIRIKGGFVF